MMTVNSFLSRPERRWAIYTIAISAFCISAFFFQEQSRFHHMAVVFVSLFFIYDFPASFVVLLVSVIGAFYIDRRANIRVLFVHLARRPQLVAVATLLVTSLGAWFLYRTHPLSMDEYAAKLQSEIFASGHLAGKYPVDLIDLLIPKPFQNTFITVSHASGAIASGYWPAFSLVMTPFTVLGVPWLCNPFLTYCTILSLAALLDAVVKDEAARGYGLLATVCSPVIIVNGMSFYGMPLQLLGSIIFTLGIIKGTPRYLFVAGIAGALSMTAVNPFPFLLYSLPWIIWLLCSGRASWKKLAWLASGGLPLALLLGIGWRVFLTLNFHAADASTSMHDKGSLLSVFTMPFKALYIARGVAMVKLWLWAVPGLIVLAVMACSMKDKPRWVLPLAGAVVLTLIGYMFVPFDQGHGWGYRYFHTVWLALPLLAAAAFERISNDASARPRLYGFALATCVGTLLLSLPLRMYQVRSFIDEYLVQIPARLEGNARQLLFVNLDCGATYDLVQNDPFFNGKELRLISQGEDKDKEIAFRLGSHPRLVSNGTCGKRWMLD